LASRPEDLANPPRCLIAARSGTAEERELAGLQAEKSAPPFLARRRPLR
jgi:hypothetical protein